MCLFKNDAVFLRNVGDTYMLISAKNEQSIVFINETGLFLWNMLENKRTMDELVEGLVNEYNVSTEIAHNDVKKFVEFMLDNDCLCMRDDEN